MAGHPLGQARVAGCEALRVGGRVARHRSGHQRRPVRRAQHALQAGVEDRLLTTHVVPRALHVLVQALREPLACLALQLSECRPRKFAGEPLGHLLADPMLTHQAVHVLVQAGLGIRTRLNSRSSRGW